MIQTIGVEHDIAGSQEEAIQMLQTRRNEHADYKMYKVLIFDLQDCKVERSGTLHLYMAKMI